ncbi:TAXI family TRAP transporter solute-binding subunit [Actinoplanes bogorensis]|uniref:TAXI family TRAP transporter solute-binding subunit n=1 Tax=Paractinoplanes bogorensis TaxID=1610840 RepID=A0ABS5YST9_9ACTN|nr:TAXI family TRAP transporter solute-binding subunit [Actinoplanes bogorensis]MBU2665793.1 TAXI family TRAP transporter solute-binding subunit [Actinoplanes bogorensis]
MTARFTRRGLFAVTAAGLVESCSPAPDHPGPVRIATGGRGGVYARLGDAIARALAEDYPSLRTEVLETTASAANLRMISAGQAEVGFTQADILTGTGLPQPAALARIHDDFLHLVVRADSDARAVTDLRGKRISPGSSGSGTEVTVTRVLAAAGMRLGPDIESVPLGVDESTRALVAGRISGFFFSGGLPVDAISGLASRVPLRLLGLSLYLPALRKEFGEVYAERTVPRSTYGVPSVQTISVPNYLVAAGALPDDVAYALTSTLLGRRDVLAATHPAAERMNHMAAIATDPLPLHPGAARYFKETKES